MARVVEIPAGLKWKWRDEILIYEMYGKLYVRQWTSLEGKRVKNDPAFALFRVYSGIQGDASRTSSRVYRQLPDERRIYSFYKILKSLAYRLLKQGFSVEEMYTLLYNAAMRDVVAEDAAPMKEAICEDVPLVNEAMAIEPVTETVCEGENPAIDAMVEQEVGKTILNATITDTSFADAVLERVFGEEVEEGVGRVRVRDLAL